jgi:hypothetical protein
MTSPRTLWLALLCSFGVYLIPIVGPHAVFLVGEAIWRQFRDFKNPAWAFSSFAAAWALQIVTFALGLWVWRRSGVLAVVVMLAWALVVLVLVQFIYRGTGLDLWKTP